MILSPAVTSDKELLNWNEKGGSVEVDGTGSALNLAVQVTGVIGATTIALHILLSQPLSVLIIRQTS